MVVQLIVFYGFLAAMSLVRALKLKLTQHLSVELVNLSWDLGEVITTAIIITNKLIQLRALIAYDILTIMTLHRQCHNIGTLRTYQILIKVNFTPSI